MKAIFTLMLFATFSAYASPVLNVKERLRLHMWVYGLEDRPLAKQKNQVKSLPEELERPLKTMHLDR